MHATSWVEMGPTGCPQEKKSQPIQGLTLDSGGSPKPYLKKILKNNGTSEMNIPHAKSQVTLMLD